MAIIKHEGNEIEIGRIVGGIGWPGEKPGFAVVVGEDLYPPVGSRVYHCYLLAEVEEQDTGQLMGRCTELAGYYKTLGSEALDFYGRYHESNIHFLNLWNADARKRGMSEFCLYQAPFSDNGLIGYHINILLDRLRPERKTLHLSLKDSKLAGYLQEIPPNEISSATDVQYPAVTALGYVVSFLTIHEPYSGEEEEYQTPQGRNPHTGY